MDWKVNNMPYPLIGVTTSRIENKMGHDSHGIAEKYVQALSAAGGAPVLIPLGLPEAQLDRIFSVLDGILFTGGGDIHPRFFGEPLNEQVNMIDEDRDRVELALFQHARQENLPFFGICRGLQLVNVGMGGTLYTDIVAQNAQADRHAFYPDIPRDLLAHPVKISPGSRLHAILGVDQVQVNSLHHQGVSQPASGLQVTAVAPDGIVEALELPENPFGLLVQWHPEWLQAHAPMRTLFKAFVQACQR
jgi:putative glutamine amidotransferase